MLYAESASRERVQLENAPLKHGAYLSYSSLQAYNVTLREIQGHSRGTHQI